MALTFVGIVKQVFHKQNLYHKHQLMEQQNESHKKEKQQLNAYAKYSSIVGGSGNTGFVFNSDISCLGTAELSVF